MKLKDVKKILLEDKSFREEYYKYDLAMEIGLKIMSARIDRGLTQAQLAKKLKTRQPSIARIENGNNLPSLKFLDKVAEILGVKLDVKITSPKTAPNRHRTTNINYEFFTKQTGVVTQDISLEVLGHYFKANTVSGGNKFT